MEVMEVLPSSSHVQQSIGNTSVAQVAGQKRVSSDSLPSQPRRRPRQVVPDYPQTQSAPAFSSMAEAVAELDAAWVNDPSDLEIAQALQKGCLPDAGNASVGQEIVVRRPNPEDETLITEVHRVRENANADFRRILGIHPGQAWDVQAIQSRYRHLMRLLHPDKRTEAAERLAGGRDACDEAVEIVQSALASAKRELGSGGEADPVQNTQQGMVRMQEIQRQRARQALKMQQARQRTSEVGALNAELDKALSSSTPAVGSRSAPSHDPKSQQINNLLVQMGANWAVPCSQPSAMPSRVPMKEDRTAQQIVGLLAQMNPQQSSASVHARPAVPVKHSAVSVDRTSQQIVGLLAQMGSRSAATGTRNGPAPNQSFAGMHRAA